MDDRGDEDGGSFLEGVRAPALATIVASSVSSILVVDAEMNGVTIGGEILFCQAKHEVVTCRASS